MLALFLFLVSNSLFNVIIVSDPDCSLSELKMPNQINWGLINIEGKIFHNVSQEYYLLYVGDTIKWIKISIAVIR